MKSSELLWVDLRRRPDVRGMCELVAADRPVVRVEGRSSVCSAISRSSPRAVCFEFDHPEVRGLDVLQAALLRFPVLPLMMLTEHHSERLAVWAFRSGVGDYLVAPVTRGEFADALSRLCDAGGALSRPHRRLPIPLEDCFCGSKPARLRTDSAAVYIESHIGAKIMEHTLAGLCHMSVSQFSREFKREHGMTLREFILRARVERAREILCRADTSVSTVAYAVGFSDLSHFTRVFRRFVGVPPTRYLRSLALVS